MLDKTKGAGYAISITDKGDWCFSKGSNCVFPTTNDYGEFSSIYIYSSPTTLKDGTFPKNYLGCTSPTAYLGNTFLVISSGSTSSVSDLGGNFTIKDLDNA